MAIIVPLFLSVDMLNDSFVLLVRTNVKYSMYKETARKELLESKANGTFAKDVLLDYTTRLSAGAKNNRR